MPDNGSQPGYMRSDTHLGNPTAWGAAHPDQSAPTASLALITPAPASSQRVEARPPGEQTAGPHRTPGGQSLRAVAETCKPVAEAAANETLVQLAREQLPWPISLLDRRESRYVSMHDVEYSPTLPLDLADDRRRAFPIVLVGEQIDALMFVKGFGADPISAVAVGVAGYFCSGRTVRSRGLLGCGQDRDGPLRGGGQALMRSRPAGLAVPGDGRQIDSRPAVDAAAD